MSTAKDHKALIKKLQRMGWSVLPTKNSHLKLLPPARLLEAHPEACSQIIVESTPSDWRSIRNTRARIFREYGVKV